MLLLLALGAAARVILLAHRQVETTPALRWTNRPPLAPGLYAVQFLTPIDRTMRARIADAVGHTPTEYVPVNSLILFINSTAMGDALAARVGARVRHVEPLQRGDRRAQWQPRQPAASQAPVQRGGRSATRPASDAATVRLHGRLIAASAAARSVDLGNGYVAQVRGNQFVIPAVPTAEANDLVDSLLDTVQHLAWIEVQQQFTHQNEWLVPSVQWATGAGGSLLGLSGTGQVLGLADTGIVVTTCYFSDGQGVKDGAWSQTTTQTVPVDLKHPKIRAYWSQGNDFNDTCPVCGHGTHVAGIATGRAAPNSDAATFNGVAKNARVAFVDLMPADATADELNVPDDIGSTILQWQSDVGASVSSNSWGSPTSVYGYTLSSASVDLFTYTNPDFLAVFAAGNGGPASGTIVTPGDAKNALTVGATMNGAAAYELAAPVSGAESDYTDGWLASYSSRGSRSLPFVKPDIVAPGGPYVWSAYNFGPSTCDDATASTIGEAGTSMATPAVAGTALLLREALTTVNRSLLAPTGGGVPRASLLRALLAAGAVPLLGAFQHKTTLAPESFGYGRVALDQSIGPGVAVLVLANEQAAVVATAAGAAFRACVSIVGVAPTASLADYELVVQLAYNDYPSSAVAAASLVNNLDLRVTVAGTASVLTGAPDPLRSTLEQVVVAPAQAVDVLVRATTIGFGQAPFSLVVLLRRADRTPGTYALAASPLAAVDASAPRCQACGAAYVPGTQCSVCGNGQLEPTEQCEAALDGTNCCDAATCTWFPVNTTCAVEIATCRVRGACQADGSCASTGQGQFQILPVGSDGSSTCQPASGSVLPSVCLRSATSWARQLRVSGLPTPLAPLQSADLRICCAPFASYAADKTPPEPLYHLLALEYIATRLNVAQPDVVVGGATLAAMSDAKQLLEAYCGLVGFLEASVREGAFALLATLQAYNEAPATACPAADDPATTLDPTAADEPWCTPNASTTTLQLDDLLCSGAPNAYNADEQRCVCAPLYQPEPDCQHLACAGHGASVYNYTLDGEQCVCLAWWAGAACDQCAPPPSGAVAVCVGLTTALQLEYSRHYVPLIADAATIGARLNGSYYPAALHKLADALPGAAADCACRIASERQSPFAFASHIDALAAALAGERADAQLAALMTTQLRAAAPAGAVKALAVSNTGSHNKLRFLIGLIFFSSWAT